MTVERSWRKDFKRGVHKDRYYVPDTRLQAIADAWRDPRMNEWVNHADVRDEWPELGDLLDALIVWGGTTMTIEPIRWCFTHSKASNFKSEAGEWCPDTRSFGYNGVCDVRDMVPVRLDALTTESDNG